MIMKRYIPSLYVGKYFSVLTWLRLPTPRPFVNIRLYNEMSATRKKYRFVDVFFKTFLKRECSMIRRDLFPVHHRKRVSSSYLSTFKNRRKRKYSTKILFFLMILNINKKVGFTILEILYYNFNTYKIVLFYRNHIISSYTSLFTYLSLHVLPATNANLFIITV